MDQNGSEEVRNIILKKLDNDEIGVLLNELHFLNHRVPNEASKEFLIYDIITDKTIFGWRFRVSIFDEILSMFEEGIISVCPVERSGMLLVNRPWAEDIGLPKGTQWGLMWVVRDAPAGSDYWCRVGNEHDGKIEFKSRGKKKEEGDDADKSDPKVSI